MRDYMYNPMDIAACMDCILEDLEGKLPQMMLQLLGKKSRWYGRKEYDSEELAEKTIRSAAEWDPTNGKYMRYITSQIAANRIRLPEDGPSLKETLILFNAKKKDWPGHNDIFKYDNWRVLQREATSYDEDTAAKPHFNYMRKWREMARKDVEWIFEQDLRIGSSIVHYKVAKCTGPIPLSLYGRGAQWCTTASPFKKMKTGGRQYNDDTRMYYKHKTMEQEVRGVASELAEPLPEWRIANKLSVEERFPFWEHKEDVDHYVGIIMGLNNWKVIPDKIADFLAPNNYFSSSMTTANSYLKNGPIYIIFKNNAPFLQIASTGEIKDSEDSDLLRTDKATAFILIKIMKVEHESLADSVRAKIAYFVKKRYPDAAKYIEGTLSAESKKWLALGGGAA